MALAFLCIFMYCFIKFVFVELVRCMSLLSDGLFDLRQLHRLMMRCDERRMVYS